MLKRMVDKRNLVTIVFSGILLVLWLLYLIFGAGEDKVLLLVWAPVLPFVVYGSVRLMFKIIRINASLKAMKVFVYCFLLGGAVGILMDVVAFITGFPNGFSPSLGMCMGLIVAALAEAKKNIEMEGEK